MGTRNVELRRLEQEIRRIAADVVQEPGGRQPIDVLFVDDDVARLYMASEQYVRAVGPGGVGRQMQGAEEGS